MDTAHLDQEMETLQANKRRWAALSVDEKIAFLDSIRQKTVEQALPWVEDAVKAKMLQMDHHLAGEEWTSGPFSVLSVTRDLRRTLVRLAEGTPVLEGHGAVKPSQPPTNRLPGKPVRFNPGRGRSQHRFVVGERSRSRLPSPRRPSHRQCDNRSAMALFSSALISVLPILR